MRRGPYLEDPDVTLYHGDCLDVLRELPDRSVHMCATSPPFYGLRDYGTGEWEGGDPDCDHDAAKIKGRADYGFSEKAQLQTSNTSSGYSAYKRECPCGARRVDQQIGLEETPDLWVDRLVGVFREVRRVLRDDGTLWVEIGDSYAASGGTNHGGGSSTLNNDGRDEESRLRTVAKIAEDMRSAGTSGRKAPNGTKQKDLLGQPWLLAFALRADGWYLRCEIIWARPNPMPESVTDRPTKSHSTVFLLSKRPRYFYDADAIREPHAQPWRGNGETERNNWSVGGTPESRGSTEIVRQYNPLGANARSVWQIPTQPTPYAHFATWPQALVRRMILAGTSERGCCPECGAPWVRETDKQPLTEPTYTEARGYSVNGQRDTITRFGDGVTVTTTGWSPACAHDTTPVPCTVLDPFAGSGTTNLVARNHGRHSIGIELNHAYLEIAARRLQQLSLLA